MLSRLINKVVKCISIIKENQIRKRVKMHVKRLCTEETIQTEKQHKHLIFICLSEKMGLKLNFKSIETSDGH